MGHSSGCHVAALVGLDPGYLANQGLDLSAVAGVVAMGCTLAPWDTAGRGVTAAQLEQSFAQDAAERVVYGSLAWRLRTCGSSRVRHFTTTTGFADPNDMVANLVAAFVRNPTAVTATP